MARHTRLLDLTQLLRRRRRATPATDLAQALGVSQRTIYRDVQALIALGAPISGEPGSGYLMQAGWRMPAPLFTEPELQALALGARWVAARADTGLAAAATSALAKISAVLPAETSPTLAPPALESVDPSVLRRAIRLEHKLRIDHADEGARVSALTVWPITLVDFDAVRLLVAWCEEDGAFRHFRCDRIVGAAPLDEGFPQTRLALIKTWHAHEAALGPAPEPL